MNLFEDITVFYKVDNVYKRKVVKASIRNTTSTTRSTYGLNENENVLIRIFSVIDYLETWHIQNGDIIVRDIANEELNTDAPITYLQEKYGKNKVYKVNSVQDNIYGSSLDHIKIGAI